MNWKISRSTGNCARTDAGIKLKDAADQNRVNWAIGGKRFYDEADFFGLYIHFRARKVIKKSDILTLRASRKNFE